MGYHHVTLAWFLFAITTIVSSTDTLHISQNITDGQQTLVSPMSIFEMGFVSLGSSQYRFVGIWFKVSPYAIVWVANRNRPLNNPSGTLTIDENGSLLLRDSLERIIWSSNTPPSNGTADINPILQLEDSGNLVLRDQKSNTIIWQSFDSPTNTLLSGMKLGKNLRTGLETYLSSWKSPSDPSEGNYKFQMDTEGAPEFIIWNRDKIKYRSGMWNGLFFSGQPGMVTYEDMFTFFFVWNQDEVSYEFQTKPTSPLSRVVLNEIGVRQRLVWDQTNHAWNDFLSAPRDECDIYATCGPFGVCQPNGMTACSCLEGFEPVKPEEWYMRNTSGGCTRRKPLGCTTKSDGFLVIKGVKVPYSHNAIVVRGITVKECKSRCLKNCSCLAYAPLDIRGQGSGCVMWNSALIDIKYVKGGQDLYVKVSQSELGTSNKRQLAVIAGTISSGIIALLLISFLSNLLWRRKTCSKKDKTEYLMQMDSWKDTDLNVYDMNTILQATGNFSASNILGQGGCGIVYKGRLPCGQAIAVKRFSRNSSQGLNEFMNEVMLINKLQHRNLVRLLGCCIHNDDRMLIYEFMINKSLDFFIFDAEKCATLSWRTKLEIITGIARGLLYLHHDSRLNIIHRDLKAANVLLDEEMNPKISDFGTARLFEKNQAVISTETVIGTRGYMSPEYITEGKFSVKSDVYSFGVLLLEIISGKRNQGNQNLVAYVWGLWEQGNILNLLHEAEGSSALTTELVRCVHVGLVCVQECAGDRPSMSSVFTMLSGDNPILPDPKKPSFCTRIIEFSSNRSLYDHDSSTVDQLTMTVIEGR